ncbi:hypothetical protein V6N11_059152 [Hibiscus sabdariffa]|uniref:UBA domain-containing protein n=1 Tax=Hibiscus sabdariffa TaxID=183260 RepID=A0ABR2U6G8_9ROSI
MRTDSKFVCHVSLVSEEFVDGDITGQSKEMVVQKIDKKLLEEPKMMGLITSRATCALHFYGNKRLKAAMNWIVEHESDSDIDVIPMVSVNSGIVLTASNFHSKKNDKIDVEITKMNEGSYAIANSLLIARSYFLDSHPVFTPLANYTRIPLVSPPRTDKTFKVQSTKD